MLGERRGGEACALANDLVCDIAHPSASEPRLAELDHETRSRDGLDDLGESTSDARKIRLAHSGSARHAAACERAGPDKICMCSRS